MRREAENCALVSNFGVVAPPRIHHATVDGRNAPRSALSPHGLNCKMGGAVTRNAKPLQVAWRWGVMMRRPPTGRCCFQAKPRRQTSDARSTCRRRNGVLEQAKRAYSGVLAGTANVVVR